MTVPIPDSIERLPFGFREPELVDMGEKLVSSMPRSRLRPGLTLDVPAGGTKVDIVGEYKPTKFEFRRGDYWPNRKMKVSEYK